MIICTKKAILVLLFRILQRNPSFHRALGQERSGVFILFYNHLHLGKFSMFLTLIEPYKIKTGIFNFGKNKPTGMGMEKAETTGREGEG